MAALDRLRMTGGIGTPTDLRGLMIILGGHSDMASDSIALELCAQPARQAPIHRSEWSWASHRQRICAPLAVILMRFAERY